MEDGRRGIPFATLDQIHPLRRNPDGSGAAAISLSPAAMSFSPAVSRCQIIAAINRRRVSAGSSALAAAYDARV